MFFGRVENTGTKEAVKRKARTKLNRTQPNRRKFPSRLRQPVSESDSHREERVVHIPEIASDCEEEAGAAEKEVPIPESDKRNLEDMTSHSRRRYKRTKRVVPEWSEPRPLRKPRVTKEPTPESRSDGDEQEAQIPEKEVPIPETEKNEEDMSSQPGRFKQGSKLCVKEGRGPDHSRPLRKKPFSQTISDGGEKGKNAEGGSSRPRGKKKIGVRRGHGPKSSRKWAKITFERRSEKVAG